MKRSDIVTLSITAFYFSSLVSFIHPFDNPWSAHKLPENIASGKAPPEKCSKIGIIQIYKTLTFIHTRHSTLHNSQDNHHDRHIWHQGVHQHLGNVQLETTGHWSPPLAANWNENESKLQQNFSSYVVVRALLVVPLLMTGGKAMVVSPTMRLSTSPSVHRCALDEGRRYCSCHRQVLKSLKTSMRREKNEWCKPDIKISPIQIQLWDETTENKGMWSLRRHWQDVRTAPPRPQSLFSSPLPPPRTWCCCSAHGPARTWLRSVCNFPDSAFNQRKLCPPDWAPSISWSFPPGLA